MKINKLCGFVLALLLLASCSKEIVEGYPVEDVWGAYSARIDSLREVVIDTDTGWEFIIDNQSSNATYYGFLGFEDGSGSSFAVDVDGKFFQKDANPCSLMIRKSNPSLAFARTSAFSDFALQEGMVDTTFSYKYAKQDTLFFLGDVFGNGLKLFRSNPENNSFFKNNAWPNLIGSFWGAVNELLESPRFFNRISTASKTGDVIFNNTQKTVTLLFQRGTGVESKTTGYYFTASGIKFTNSDVVETLGIEGIENVQYADSQLKFTGGSIENTGSPAAYDQDAARQFLYEAPTLWTTKEGFGRRGEPDIAGIRNIPNLRFMVYWPKYNISGSTEYDMWGFFSGAWEAGQQAPISSITEDKLVKFQPWGSFGNPTSQQVVDALVATAPILYNSKGFYAVQYGNGFYLVDARDGLTWAFWEPES